MRLTIIASGSRGDVQPYVALGKGLQQAGHGVRLLTHENYATLVAAHELEFWPMRGDVQAVAQSAEMQALLEKGNFLAITAHTAKLAKEAALHWAEDGLASCQGTDLILAGIGGMNTGIALAEKLGIPFVQAPVVPFTPTAAFPGALFPQAVGRLGGTVNRFSHHLVRQVMWQGFRGADSAARQQVLGLPPAPFFGPYRSPSLVGQPVLCGVSPSVIPQPADWGENVHMTGYWFLDAEDDWTPPPALADFLAAGPPPVAIGFGSMSNRNPAEMTRLLVAALAQAGQRAVLLSGWQGMATTDLPDSILMIESAPHAWLFPRTAATVHHGGAGTTAAALRAGKPSLVIPFFGDQPFWGQRIADLGVGPAPIPRKRLAVDNLAQAIQQMATDGAMRRKADVLGAKI
ncbi:MAG: glycosyltransferase, partial [Caldilineaceae bacterium]